MKDGQLSEYYVSLILIPTSTLDETPELTPCLDVDLSCLEKLLPALSGVATLVALLAFAN